MEQQADSCEHRWRYFFDVASRTVKSRICERCHQRSVVPALEDCLLGHTGITTTSRPAARFDGAAESARGARGSGQDYEL